MDLLLKDKSVLVTAASKGLGKACALEFAREGARVTIASRHADTLTQTADEIRSETGQPVNTVVLDVTKPQDILSAVSAAVEFGGGLDVLVTNAGGPPSGAFASIADDAWYGAFELNLMSVVRLIREALPHMQQRGAGRIVTITSTSIKQPLENLVLSNTLRAGVYGLTKTLSLELAKDGILVNTVGPGRVATDRIAELDTANAARAGIAVGAETEKMVRQIPIGRYGNPEEFGKAVVFLCSFAQSYITGQALLVDGGLVKAL